MNRNEIDSFIEIWNAEAERTLKVMETLPRDKYDFRPDPEGRSLGELAWHLAEIDGYFSDGAAKKKVDFAQKIPNLTRPREIEALTPGYRKVHQEAVERVRTLKPEDLDLTVSLGAPGMTFTIRDLLWNVMLHHAIHHRCQLCMLNRQAGGKTPGIYGPNREEMRAMQAAQAQARN